MEAKDFLKMYETYFTTLRGRAKTSMLEWAFDKNAEVMERMFINIEYENEGKNYNPRLPELRRRYRNLRGGGGGRSNCPRCRGEAWCVVVMAGRSPLSMIPVTLAGMVVLNGEHGRQLETVPEGWQYRTNSIPCMCEGGGLVANKRMHRPYTLPVLKRLHDNCVRTQESADLYIASQRAKNAGWVSEPDPAIGKFLEASRDDIQDIAADAEKREGVT